MRVLLRWWFDLDPVLGAPAWPVGAGQSFGDQAFQAEPADLGEQRSAGSDDSLGEGQLWMVELFDQLAEPTTALREWLGQ